MLSSIAGQSFFGIDLKSLPERFRRIRKSISTRYLLIDFGLDKITLCELSLKGLNIRFDHLQEIPLPLEALDRGIPVDAIEMSALIREYCREEGVPAHRAIVGIHEDALYLTTIKLPAQLAEEIITQREFSDQVEAMIPVQVANYEVSLSLCAPPLADDDNANYLISALPNKYLDQLIDTLAKSGHQIIGVYPSSLIQSIAISRLYPCPSPEEFNLVLDFRSEHTLATFHFKESPVRVSRLTAVPALTAPSPKYDNASIAATNAKPYDRSIDKNNYQLDELDLRRLAQELRTELDLFSNAFSSSVLNEILIIENSHTPPNLPSILQALLHRHTSCRLHEFTTPAGYIRDYNSKISPRILSLASILLDSKLIVNHKASSDSGLQIVKDSSRLTGANSSSTDNLIKNRVVNNISYDKNEIFALSSGVGSTNYRENITNQSQKTSVLDDIPRDVEALSFAKKSEPTPETIPAIRDDDTVFITPRPSTPSLPISLVKDQLHPPSILIEETIQKKYNQDIDSALAESKQSTEEDQILNHEDELSLINGSLNSLLSETDIDDIQIFNEEIIKDSVSLMSAINTQAAPPLLDCSSKSGSSDDLMDAEPSVLPEVIQDDDKSDQLENLHNRFIPTSVSSFLTVKDTVNNITMQDLGPSQSEEARLTRDMLYDNYVHKATEGENKRNDNNN